MAKVIAPPRCFSLSLSHLVPPFTTSWSPAQTATSIPRTPTPLLSRMGPSPARMAPVSIPPSSGPSSRNRTGTVVSHHHFALFSKQTVIANARLTPPRPIKSGITTISSTYITLPAYSHPSSTTRLSIFLHRLRPMSTTTISIYTPITLRIPKTTLSIEITLVSTSRPIPIIAHASRHPP